jgi:NADPH:quinone reductase-like Zn-dependent oxidoreductase
VPGLPDWTTVPVPGHTVDSVALFRPVDRVLLTGDAVLTVDVGAPWRNLSSAPQLAGPPWVSTWDPRRALASVRALAALDPRVLAPGHGRTWTGEGTAAALRGLADRLEREPRWARDAGPGKAPQPRRTYRSLVVGERGGPEVLRPAQSPLRSPGRAEVRARVLASLVCGPDVQARRGYGPFPPRLPFVPGYAVVGEVDAVGAGVRDVRVGQRVGALTIIGGYAEYVYLSARQLFPVPATVDPGAAAVVALNYLVAYQVLHRAARVRAGQTVLITGAGGGIGTAFLQLGRLAGLTMYGVDTAAKHPLIERYGAVPIDHRTQDVAAAIRHAEPQGLDAVLDGVGGDYLSRGLSILRPWGTLVAYGNPGSRRGLLRLLATTLAVNARPHGKRMKVYGTTASRHHAALEDWSVLYRLLEDGLIEPVLADRLPLLDAERGNAMLESGAVTGTVVLVTPELLADRGTSVGERESSGTTARRRS